MIESINLNLIPSGVSPVCHVSQYDAGRQIKINLFEGINPYTIQSGDAFTLNVRKPDNTIVTTSVSGTQGNTYITISTTEQIAAVVGENLCELKITNGSTVIGTLNFIMQVERDVLADGVPSQSVIEDLDERIAEAIGDNYYNKTETDALLDDKADKNNTYTKTETDTLLNNKADKSNTYNKTETDSLLALKADKSEIYNVYPTDQESGAIASFTDGAENIPVKSLVSEIVAVESGNGQPKSPDNPYTISGFDSGIVSVCGVNIWNEQWELGTFLSGQLIPSITRIRNKYPIPVKPNTTYYFKSPAVACYIMQVDKDSNWTQYESAQVNLVFTTKSWAKYIYFSPVETYGATYNNDISINYPSSDIDYHAYNGNNYTFTFGQTVYGGYFDNKGNLVVTHKILNFDYQSDWRYENLLGGNFYVACGSDIKASQFGDDLSCNCSPSSSVLAVTSNTCLISVAKNFNFTWGGTLGITNVDDFKTYLQTNNLVIKVKCLLATPITLAITSQDIPTLLGENNIFSDTGDVDVTIRADIGLYIDKRLNANRSTPNNLSRAASYVDDPESVNETQEDNVEPQNDER